MFRYTYVAYLSLHARIKGAHSLSCQTDSWPQSDLFPWRLCSRKVHNFFPQQPAAQTNKCNLWSSTVCSLLLSPRASMVRPKWKENNLLLCAEWYRSAISLAATDHMLLSIVINLQQLSDKTYDKGKVILCRYQWPRGLSRRSAAARLLRFWV